MESTQVPGQQEVTLKTFINLEEFRNMAAAAVRNVHTHNKKKGIILSSTQEFISKGFLQQVNQEIIKLIEEGVQECIGKTPANWALRIIKKEIMIKVVMKLYLPLCRKDPKRFSTAF
jgi:hypothetical protein